MPSRPSNITSFKDILPTINQLMRELAVRIDKVQSTIPNIHVLAGNAELSFGMIPAGSSVTRNIQLRGVKQTAAISASPQLEVGQHLQWSARPNGTDSITIVVSNPTTSPITANTVKWNVTAQQ